MTNAMTKIQKSHLTGGVRKRFIEKTHLSFLDRMNYISISQRLAAVTFFGVLASLCNMYGSIFLINEVCFLDLKENRN